MNRLISLKYNYPLKKKNAFGNVFALYKEPFQYI